MQSRVFCHVSDVVRAITSVASSDETIGEVFNIGGKSEITILELAKLVIEITRSTSEIVFIGYEKAYGYGFEDMEKRIPDISKITQQLNWSPILSINEIISNVVTDYVR